MNIKAWAVYIMIAALLIVAGLVQVRAGACS
jgi:hypothetical protein